MKKRFLEKWIFKKQSYTHTIQNFLQKVTLIREKSLFHFIFITFRYFLYNFRYFLDILFLSEKK
jgi:hypothetical protein